MTYLGGEYSNNDLFGEVMDSAIREGVSTPVQFRDLVDEIVEEKRIYGFFSDDEDLTQIKENLQMRWNEIEKETRKK